MIYALAVLMVLDTYLTDYALKRGGREVNPVARWVMERVGVWGAGAVMKGPVYALVYFAADESLTAAAVAAYLLVIVHNIYQLGK